MLRSANVEFCTTKRPKDPSLQSYKTEKNKKLIFEKLFVILLDN